MTLIEQLIQMKKSEKENDIIKILDELTLYDKLSTVKALGNIEESSALQKRLPYLSEFINGSFYQTSLVIAASHVLNHLEYELPDVIQEKIENIPERTKKQLAIASGSTVQPVFREFIQYDHEIEEQYVVGVYTKKIEEETKIIIITNPTQKEYIIYQGDYVEEVKETEQDKEHLTIVHKDYVKELKHGQISIGNYSMAGNNHYPFAEYSRKGTIFYLSIPKQDQLQLTTQYSLLWNPNKEEEDKKILIQLTQEEVNQIGLSRQNIKEFTEAIGSIIQRWEEQL